VGAVRETLPRDRNSRWTFRRAMCRTSTVRIPVTQFFCFIGAGGSQTLQRGRHADGSHSELSEIVCNFDFHTPSRPKESYSAAIYHCGKLFCKVWTCPAGPCIKGVPISERLRKKLIYLMKKQFSVRSCFKSIALLKRVDCFKHEFHPITLESSVLPHRKHIATRATRRMLFRGTMTVHV
jgi:hypothetical protein